MSQVKWQHLQLFCFLFVVCLFLAFQAVVNSLTWVLRFELQFSCRQVFLTTEPSHWPSTKWCLTSEINEHVTQFFTESFFWLCFIRSTLLTYFNAKLQNILYIYFSKLIHALKYTNIVCDTHEMQTGQLPKSQCEGGQKYLICYSCYYHYSKLYMWPYLYFLDK